MPDKDPERLKPATDLLASSSQRVASDRARRINSLHKQVNSLLQEETKKRRQVGSEVGSIIQQQQDLRKELQYARDEISADVASGYGKIVNNLGSTIKQMSIGMKNISISTAQASADAISQYGKAIGQDIHINKTNTIAMALSRATPIFGYFAAKFMETDVFRGAISKIRQGVGAAMLAGLRGAGSSISNIFRGKKSVSEKVSGKERELGALSSEVASLKKELQAKPPQLQTGGYVKKGGVVQVHAAEVIAPVDSLVKQIVETTQEQQKTFFKTFVKEFKKGGSASERAWQDRMLKALLELKVAFIGTTSRLRIAWQRTLLENPAFRGMLLFAEGFKAVLGAPIKWLFGARGGYLSDVKRATATDNVFLKIANMLGVTYTMMMPKLDAIAKYTRVSATVAAGYEPTAPIMDRYTMFQKVKGFLAGGKKKGKVGEGIKEDIYDRFLGFLGLEEDEIENFKKEGGFKSVFGLAKEAGEAAKVSATGLVMKGKEAAEAGTEKTKDFFGDIKAIRKLKELQEDREKPKSPSWVEYVGMTFGKAKETAKQGWKQTKTAVESYIEVRKSRKANEAQLSFLGRMTKRLKRLSGMGWKLLMFGFNMFQSAINVGVNLLGNILSPLLTALGLRGLFKTGGKGFIKTAGEGLKKGAKGLGKFAGKTAAVGKTAGGVAAAKFAAKGAAKTGAGLVGRVALGAGKVAAGVGGAVVGGVVGGAMGIWDMLAAIRAGESPEGFVGGWITRGIAGFLGGKETGAAGALSGAMKLGGIGAAIGLIGGPIGVLIGGAIGAAAGALLGFVGGHKISKAISAITAPIKGYAKAWWAVVSFPFKFIREMVQLVKFYLTEHPTGKKVWAQIKFWAPKIVFPPLMFIWAMKKGYGIIKNTVANAWEKVKEKLEEYKSTWYGKTVTLMWDTFTKPFTWVGNAVGFIGDMFGKVVSGVTEWINSVIKKIKDLPFIGKFLKGLKEIHEGTFAERRAAGWKPEAPKTIPGGFETAGGAGLIKKKGLTPEQIEKFQEEGGEYALKLLKATAGEWNKEGKLVKAQIDGKWYKVKLRAGGMPQEIKQVDLAGKTLNIPVQKELSERKAAAAHLQNMAETMSDKLDETADKSNKVAIGNTTMLNNTITNNTSNTASGGGGGGGGIVRDFWGSGANAANDVTYSVLN